MPARPQAWRRGRQRRGKRFASSAALPLKDETGVFAVLTIDAAETGAFDAEELKLLQELANDLAFGIRSLREHFARESLDQRWRASLEATVGAIASTVEMRDAYTAGHQRRVAQLAVAIARKLAMSEHDIQGIYLAGIIHDVGKIIVPVRDPQQTRQALQDRISADPTARPSRLRHCQGRRFPVADRARWCRSTTSGSTVRAIRRALRPTPFCRSQDPRRRRRGRGDDVTSALSRGARHRRGTGRNRKMQGNLFDPAAVDACLALFREKRFHFD